jgi:hypothetical protein
MKGLIIIIGESFRLGSQETRVRGVPESYDQQINACNSHIKFLNNLKNKFNCDASVYLSTYDTKYNDNLLEIYKDYLVGHKIYETLIGLPKLFKNSVMDNKDNLQNYDFIFYLRIDLFLKDHFIDIFDPNWNTIKFPTICWIKFNTHKGKPRVNDVMLFIPKKFFDYLDNIPICHEAWYILTNELHISDNDMDVMINTYHDSDSEKDFNPLYYIVNRPESTTWHSENEIFSFSSEQKDKITLDNLNFSNEIFSEQKPVIEQFTVLKKNNLIHITIIKIIIFLLTINLFFNLL